MLDGNNDERCKEVEWTASWKEKRPNLILKRLLDQCVDKKIPLFCCLCQYNFPSLPMVSRAESRRLQRGALSMSTTSNRMTIITYSGRPKPVHQQQPQQRLTASLWSRWLSSNLSFSVPCGAAAAAAFQVCPVSFPITPEELTNNQRASVLCGVAGLIRCFLLRNHSER